MLGYRLEKLIHVEMSGDGSHLKSSVILRVRITMLAQITNSLYILLSLKCLNTSCKPPLNEKFKGYFKETNLNKRGRKESKVDKLVPGLY